MWSQVYLYYSSFYKKIKKMATKLKLQQKSIKKEDLDSADREYSFSTTQEMEKIVQEQMTETEYATKWYKKELKELAAWLDMDTAKWQKAYNKWVDDIITDQIETKDNNDKEYAQILDVTDWKSTTQVIEFRDNDELIRIHDNIENKDARPSLAALKTEIITSEANAIGAVETKKDIIAAQSKIAPEKQLTWEALDDKIAQNIESAKVDTDYSIEANIDQKTKENQDKIKPGDAWAQRLEWNAEPFQKMLNWWIKTFYWFVWLTSTWWKSKEEKKLIKEEIKKDAKSAIWRIDESLDLDMWLDLDTWDLT